ncbi:MAG: ABC transporter permease, partial [Ekhidna sp.]|nr:ABC transporter permease [Ekhidna sp.]
MFRNNLKIAWRGLVKHKMYSFIKIGGLSIGIAACLLISLFVIEEVSHDQDYQDKDRIYRLISFWNEPGENRGRWTAHQAPLAGLMQEQFPEVELSARLIPYAGWYYAGDNQVRRADKTQNKFEEGFAYADPALFEILEIDMVYGDRSNALSQPNSIVLSKSKADSYFPNENPIGKTLILDENSERPWVISGVMEDNDPQKHLHFDFLLTLVEEEFWNGEQTSWCCSNYNTYIKTRSGVDPKDLQDKMTDKFKDNYVPYLEAIGSLNVEATKDYYIFELQPVSDIHLYSADIGDVMKNSDIKIVYLFSAIAIFVLILACINFMNLSTAQSENRAKEVGIRKSVGSSKIQLIGQFLSESYLA